MSLCFPLFPLRIVSWLHNSVSLSVIRNACRASRFALSTYSASLPVQPDEAILTKLSTLLDIPSDSLTTALGPASGYMVHRGATWEMPPKDPVLYRLYEVLVVYGYSYKALIAEKVSLQMRCDGKQRGS